MATTTMPAWIGAPPTRLQATAILYVGITAVMIAGLQPLLLGALQAEGRLTAAQLGHAATAELLTMGVTASIAGAWLKPKALRWVGLGAGLLLAVIDALTPQRVRRRRDLDPRRGRRAQRRDAVDDHRPDHPGAAARAVVGGVPHPPDPGPVRPFRRPHGLGDRQDGRGRRFPRPGGDERPGRRRGPCRARRLRAAGPHRRAGGAAEPRGAAALAACFLFLACIVGVWVYAEPLSHQSGHPPAVAGTAISLSLAFQVLGGTAATLLAGRLRWFWVLLGCTAVDLALLAIFAALPGAAVFLAVSAAFGFIWLFLMPFLVPMTIQADPTRRSAILLGGAQLLGGSLGPLMASTLVTDSDARGALAFGAGCLLVAMAIVAALHMRPAREVAV